MPQTIFHPAAENRVMTDDWGELTWFADGEMGNSEEVTVGRCVIKPGRKNPTHTHPNCSEVLTVMAGRIEHAVEGGRTVRMGVGDTITIAPGFFHYAENVGHEDAELFIVFTSAHREVQGE